MKPGGGKQKGSGFEREICKMLSVWVSKGNSDNLFWRSAMSGGRATVRVKKGQETTHGQGDISAITPEGNKLTDLFIIECKNYKSLDFDSYLYGQGLLVGIWKKLQNETPKNKKPMLVLKENRRPILVGLPFICPGLITLAIYKSNLHLYYLQDLFWVYTDFADFIERIERMECK
jgi:hypothetical protein